MKASKAKRRGGSSVGRSGQTRSAASGSTSNQRSDVSTVARNNPSSRAQKVPKSEFVPVHRAPDPEPANQIGSIEKKTLALFNGGSLSGGARRLVPPDVVRAAQRTLDILNAARFEDLAQLPGNNLERLHGNLSGSYSIRVNKQYRVVFKLDQGRYFDVRVVDYH